MHRDSHVLLGRLLYSVPRRFNGKTVSLRAAPDKVAVLVDDIRITAHARPGKARAAHSRAICLNTAPSSASAAATTVRSAFHPTPVSSFSTSRTIRAWARACQRPSQLIARSTMSPSRIKAVAVTRRRHQGLELVRISAKPVLEARCYRGELETTEARACMVDVYCTHGAAGRCDGPSGHSSALPSWQAWR